MNRLIKIFSFVLCLSFSLLLNVSYADFGSSPLSYTSINTGGSGYGSTQIGNYTSSQIFSICNNYFNNQDNSDYKSSFDTLINSLKSNGLHFVAYTKEPVNVYGNYYFILESNVSVGVAHYDSGSDYLEFTAFDTSVTDFNNVYMITSSDFGRTFAAPTNKCIETIYGDLVYSTITIKSLYVVSSAFSADIYWDGTSYYYEAPTTPDGPEMPTNAEIASAVQMFYNSVYQLPNTAFKDFVVLYDNTTGLYTYIGHTRGNALGQVIVEPNGYYEGYKFDVQWWKFFLDEQNDSWNWQNLDSYFNYYVYSSDGTIENLNYVGKSNISGLIEKSGPWATANTVIVYSTNDYPVKYVTFSEDSPDPDIQTGTIQGDQYTYDENLDITDNNYNPLDNFISVNYPSTLVGSADFDSFLNIFNENKDVLILPQNANWVILANNSLFDHFSSFIIMCTVFIILQRVMRG